ncbi:Spo0E family sporulation regulatory protein-aspartic acid phosphatase [Paenibacillus sp. TAF58]
MFKENPREQEIKITTAKIEVLRELLIETFIDRGSLLNNEVLNISQQIDKLLNTLEHLSKNKTGNFAKKPKIFSLHRSNDVDGGIYFEE